MKKKLLSAILVTTMLFLSACNSTASSTTKANNEPGKTEAETSADASETTKASENDKGAAPDSTGKYTYTVYAGTEYETTLKMDIDLDKYLLNIKDKSQFFSTGYLCIDLGWIANGDSNWTEKDDPLMYYAYVYGDTQMVFRYEDPFGSKDNPSGYEQLYGFSYHLAPIDNYLADAKTNEEIKTSDLNYGIYVTFRPHSDALCYHTAGNKSRASGISRDDAILIAYLLSSAVTHPGENPFVGTNLQKAVVSRSEDYFIYNLP